MKWLINILDFLKRFLTNGKCLVGLVILIFFVLDVHINTTLCLAIIGFYCIFMGLTEIMRKDEVSKSES